MKLDNLSHYLKENFSSESFDFKRTVNLARFSTMRLEAIGNILIIKDVGTLRRVLPYLNENKISYHLVGMGANQILDSQTDSLYLKVDFPFDFTMLQQVQDEYVLPASVTLHSLTQHAQKFGLVGWEVFTGIPATLGGAIFMNAGTNLGEIGSLVKWVRLITPKGEERVETIKKESFSYRANHFVNAGEIIIEACLVNRGLSDEIGNKIKAYLEMRMKSQPLSEKTCGCVFKNFSKDWRAGQLIDQLGLKGLSYNGLKVSHKHANFIENKKEANSRDFIFLGHLIQRELEYQYGLKFDFEVQF